ncbi:MAG: prepilin-type N-terminal cleavage/methylation domain-containing protein [Patescibacteria group bacterium]|nr:prepilin-type N-terminal cleavage/methylation domain-containing protein [Patescibacteria group bacterium]
MAVVSKGFTLLELLVTISIIGILIGIGSVSFSTAQKKGRDSRRQGDLAAVQKAMEQCYALDTEYPVALPTIGDPLECGALPSTTLQAVPADPKDSTLGYIEVGTWGDDYRLCADLESDGVWDGTNQDYCVSNQQ